MVNIWDRPCSVRVEWETGHLNTDLYSIAFQPGFRNFYNKALKISTNTDDWYGPLREYVAARIDYTARELPAREAEYEDILARYNEGTEYLESNFTRGTRPYNAARKMFVKPWGNALKDWKRHVADLRRDLKYGTANLALLEKLA